MTRTPEQSISRRGRGSSDWRVSRLFGSAWLVPVLTRVMVCHPVLLTPAAQSRDGPYHDRRIRHGSTTTDATRTRDAALRASTHESDMVARALYVVCVDSHVRDSCVVFVYKTGALPRKVRYEHTSIPLGRTIDN